MQLGAEVQFFARIGSPAAARTEALMPTTSLPRFDIRSLPTLIAAARRIKPAAIFTYGGPETVLAAIIARLAPTKIIRFRGEAVRSSSHTYRWRQRTSLDHLDLVLAPSQRLAFELSALGVKTPVEVVTLGCDTTRFYQSLGSPVSKAERPRILVFGRFDPVKGHATMIQRMAHILALWGQKPNRPALHIVGEPANVTVSELEQETRQAGLTVGTDVVISSSRINDVASLLASSALGVVPSLGSEIICRVAQEFLLCGTPVAVSGAGSLPEVLFEDAGFTFDGEDPKADLDHFINWTLRSANETHQRKAARAAAAKERFSLEAMATRLDQVFKTHFGSDFI